MTDFAKQMMENLERAEANFKDNLRKLAEPPSFNEMLSPELMEGLNPLNQYNAASHFINDVLENVNSWRSALPEGAESTVNLVMPDGRYMLVKELHPLGFQGFAAHGYVDGAQCRINGHISGLVIVGIELAKSSEAGFIPKRAKAIESPATPE